MDDLGSRDDRHRQPVALADCVPSKGAPDLVTRKGQAPVTGTDSTVTASCRKSEQVVSAGFTSDTAFVPFAFHRGSKRNWGVRGATFGSDGTGKVFAYCEKPASPANLRRPARIAQR